MKIRLLHDWMLVEIEEIGERKTAAGVLLIGPEPVRKARVLATGPGRCGRKGKLIPITMKPGDRFPFFKAVTETLQGRALALHLPDNQALVRENDVLFAIEEGDVEVSML